MYGNNGTAAVTSRTVLSPLLREGGTIRRLNNQRLMQRMNTLTQAEVKFLFALLCVSVVLPLCAATGNSHTTIDTERSTLTFRVYKAGVLSAFGHKHEIRAPIREGFFDEEKNTVELDVDARTLRVIDSDVSDKDRAEIQSTMLGPKVLNSAEFAEIRFRSTEVSRAGENKWTVHGDLTLHG